MHKHKEQTARLHVHTPDPIEDLREEILDGLRRFWSNNNLCVTSTEQIPLVTDIALQILGYGERQTPTVMKLKKSKEDTTVYAKGSERARTKTISVTAASFVESEPVVFAPHWSVTDTVAPLTRSITETDMFPPTILLKQEHDKPTISTWTEFLATKKKDNRDCFLVGAHFRSVWQKMSWYYGMLGDVEHGAFTLPDDAYPNDKRPHIPPWIVRLPKNQKVPQDLNTVADFHLPLFVVHMMQRQSVVNKHNIDHVPANPTEKHKIDAERGKPTPAQKKERTKARTWLRAEKQTTLAYAEDSNV
eukprot:TRINITY_DN66737_c17_g1_i1.p1 TRINITY_DN66737_c17_g1~~TRINITY_DN66737_c17_g1_i1.p1  ORF type:complete len:335 (+),score=33.35 TRINITY_DN66737_c17_g1_i1:99-1007(+)